MDKALDSSKEKGLGHFDNGFFPQSVLLGCFMTAPLSLCVTLLVICEPVPFCSLL